MKITLKSIVALVAMVVSVLGNLQVQAATMESQYNIFLYWTLGPVRTNQTSSPAYDQWSKDITWSLYTNQTMVKDVGYRLLPEYVLQPAGVLNSNTLHLMVRVVGKNGAKVSLDMLRFSARSTDSTNNTLGNEYSLVGLTGLAYSPRAIGVNYGPGGARVSDALDMSGSGSLLKDEIDFVGMQCKYFPYIDMTNWAQITRYLTNTVLDFRLTGDCQVVGADNVVLGFAQRTLQVKGVPVQPILSINRSSVSNVLIGINMETNRTAIIFSSLKLVPSVWSLEGTYNANDVLQWPLSDVDQKFYRAQLE